MFRFLAEAIGFLRDLFRRIFRVRTPEERLAAEIKDLEAYHNYIEEELKRAFIAKNATKIAHLRTEVRSIAVRLLRLRQQQKQASRAAGQ